ncbi:MAG: alpha-N-acetylglucosaminidase [Odoribacter sp.]
MSLLFLGACSQSSQNLTPIESLLNRIDPKASAKFQLELIDKASENEFFELDQNGTKIVVRANTLSALTTGINWYFKYYAGIHLSWNGMKARLPEQLPPIKQKLRKETTKAHRYDLNYCTYSYSMAFWDWKRWEQELDWMALHGVNMPLALTGMEAVWYNVLDQLGYSKKEINEFIAGPGFLAWWYMNNQEGWGGPNPDSWYVQQISLMKKILTRMDELGIDPVFPGYSGMIPNNAGKKLGLNVADPGLWCGIRRPAFLLPTDPGFDKIAALYYQEMEKLFGKAKYYSMDPFHEGGNTSGIDLKEAGSAIWKAMKQANEESVWVIQAWGENPRPQMINHLSDNDVLVLDLFSESRPMWGDPNSPWFRENGYENHPWLYCMLLNFGGNVGLHGKMQRLIDGYYLANEHPNGQTLKGIGATMEGIENNPVMYELLFELPWRDKKFSKEEWLKEYVFARYGNQDTTLVQAWEILANTSYNSPYLDVSEGTTESVFCARPKEDIKSVSTWGTSRLYYNPADLRKGAELMLSVADQYKGNNNFEYDLIDVVRQTIADQGNILQKVVTDAFRTKNKPLFKEKSEQFIHIMRLQDELLMTRAEFMVGPLLASARNIGADEEAQKLYEWNARTQISSWGDRHAANNGGLHDYSHREWAGILSDLYIPRWETYFNHLTAVLNGAQMKEIDYFAMEEAWCKDPKVYPVKPLGDPVETARRIYKEIMK